MEVEVYFNLHKKIWSVRNRKTRKVSFHLKDVLLTNVQFVVSESGRQRVLREKRKNVHAFARGQLESNQPLSRKDLKGYRQAYYNPYKTKHFVDIKTGEVLDKIYTIFMRADKTVWYKEE